MKKKTFLKQLEEELSSLPQDDIDDIIEDYNEYFAEGKKDKRTEEDLVKGLGNPKQLAKNLKAEYHIKKAKEGPSVKNILKAILASVSLGLFNIIILLGPVIAAFAVIISLYAVIFSLFVASVAVFAVSFPITFLSSVIVGIAVFFASIALVSVAVLLLLAVNFITKYFLKGLVAYMKLNIKIVRGEKLWKHYT